MPGKNKKKENNRAELIFKILIKKSKIKQVLNIHIKKNHNVPGKFYPEYSTSRYILKRPAPNKGKKLFTKKYKGQAAIRLLNNSIDRKIRLKKCKTQEENV